jgi:hypothetical protein
MFHILPAAPGEHFAENVDPFVEFGLSGYVGRGAAWFFCACYIDAELDGLVLRCVILACLTVGVGVGVD